MPGGEKQEVWGAAPNAVLILHLTWGCISPGQPEEPPCPHLASSCFLPGQASSSGPHFLFSQLNVISSRAFQSHLRPTIPTTPNFLLFSGFDVLFSHQHLLEDCIGTCLESSWLPASTQALWCIPGSSTAPGTKHFAA